MFGWLAKKGEDARVFMCIKEVKWDLENAPSIKRAMILALAQLFRNEMFTPMGVPQDIFDKPLEYTRSDLLQFYSVLENIRNQSTMQIDATKKNMRSFGMELPAFAIDHAQNSNRGLEVWMCTLGAGISPDKRDQVREIWDMLSTSRESFPAAIQKLRDIEAQTGAMTGQSQGMFDEMDDEMWLDACEYTPASFIKSFSLND